MTTFLGSGGGYSTSKIRSTIKSNPEEALPMVEVELAKDPYHPQMNDLLFDAAMRLNMLETAAFALETVRIGAPSNTKLLHKLADHYLARDLPEKAVAVYNDIIARDPTDLEAKRLHKDAEARASMKKAKKSEEEGYEIGVKEPETEAEKEPENIDSMTRQQLRELLEKKMGAYTEDQNNLKLVVEIAKIYELMGYAPDAFVFYDWGYQLSNNDISLKNKAALMKRKMEEEEFNMIKMDAEKHPENEEYQEKYKKAIAEKAREGGERGASACGCKPN